MVASVVFGREVSPLGVVVFGREVLPLRAFGPALAHDMPSVVLRRGMSWHLCERRRHVARRRISG
ncbi:hypothetical protein [Curtobacterium sp. P97]|uniref:hypothetical protein n=1 Tax=Curtobacterium sp. P97 TaxID=2939562 RepID=UPI00203FF1A8|nr:hypothetical protein [Curtobacterium sp. P97]MCM3522673.1 hypothetical protein [Curtobacterium sp. P97]